MLQLHKSQENPYIAELYATVFGGDDGGRRAHELLHTHFRNHRRIIKESFDIAKPKQAVSELEVNVCFGTGCYLKGSQKVMKDILEHMQANGLNEKVTVKASFCFEKCGRGPVVEIGGREFEACDGIKAINEINRRLGLKTMEAAK